MPYNFRKNTKRQKYGNSKVEFEGIKFDSNKEIYWNVIDYVLNERYTSNFLEQLDNFSGIIDNNNMKSDERFKFYDAYNNLDEVFSEIKRNNPDYIK